jgi:hypothetical protein
MRLAWLRWVVAIVAAPVCLLLVVAGVLELASWSRSPAVPRLASPRDQYIEPGCVFEVSGIVTVNGRPEVGVRLTMLGGGAPIAMTRGDGSFVLTDNAAGACRRNQRLLRVLDERFRRARLSPVNNNDVVRLELGPAAIGASER